MTIRGKCESARGRSWIAEKRPVLYFVVVVGTVLAVFHAAFTLWFSAGDAFEAYLAENAEAAAGVIRVMGDEARSAGTQIISPRFSLDIRRGCDGIQASAFFVVAVAASPIRVSVLARIVPILIGTALLLVINIVRIVSLYFAGIYVPSLFDLLHVDLWQAGFIFLPICFWLLWLRWATRRTSARSDGST